MAIVRDIIEKVGGKVFIETQKNQGTTFRLILPVSRTIFKGLRVVANKKQFVIKDPTEKHCKYLNAMGFKKTGNENGVSVYKR